MINYSMHHISINVKDIEVSKAFYCNLGFVDYFSYSDDEVSILHLKKRGFILELFCYKNNHDFFYEPLQLDRHHRFIGCEHFSLSVENIEDAYSELEPYVENGAKITAGRTNIKYFFILDPDGIRIEIVEDNRSK